ncbi:MAG: hypothetical protein QM820_31030 [Minicystis sp.]
MSGPSEAGPGSSAGPIDGNAWPARLTARVVDPGPPARIHGYEVDADLALRYRFTDLLRLALAGELPTDAQGRAFDLALQLLAPIDVSTAPAHAGVLARTCGARSSATIAISALALAEHARHLVAGHAPLLQWLDDPRGPLPTAFVTADTEEAAAVDRIRAAVHDTGLDVPALSERPTRPAALLSIVHACGLRRAEQIEAVLVMARMPCVLAEAFATTVVGFQDYPMRLPPFRHEEIR